MPSVRKATTVKSKKGGGKAVAPRISVRKSTTVKRVKNGVLVKEEYTPTGKGRTKTGYTHTESNPKSRNASQTGRSSQSSDKKRTARAPGKRAQKGAGGKPSVYYEYRENRSDASTRSRI